MSSLNAQDSDPDSQGDERPDNDSDSEPPSDYDWRDEWVDNSDEVGDEEHPDTPNE